jgi:hypothetical protein
MIGTRNPSTDEAVAIVSNQMTKAGQVAQLRFMRQTQGDIFAQNVKNKVVAAGKVKK